MSGKKQITINDLGAKVDTLSELIKGGFKFVRQEMAGLARQEDLKKMEKTLNYIYEMLDNETSFIQKMRTEYPIFIKRFERIEKQLGLPHTILESE